MERGGGGGGLSVTLFNGTFPCLLFNVQHLPRVNLGNISHFIELGQLGLVSDGTVYVHGNKVCRHAGLSVRCEVSSVVSALHMVYALGCCMW